MVRHRALGCRTGDHDVRQIDRKRFPRVRHDRDGRGGERVYRALAFDIRGKSHLDGGSRRDDGRHAAREHPQALRRAWKQLRDALEEFKKRFAFIGDVRGMGLMQGLELVEDRKTKEPSPKKTLALMEAAKRQGLLIGKGGLYGNVIRIAPSMLITKAEVEDGCQRLERALAEVK